MNINQDLSRQFSTCARNYPGSSLDLFTRTLSVPLTVGGQRIMLNVIAAPNFPATAPQFKLSVPVRSQITSPSGIDIINFQPVVSWNVRSDLNTTIFHIITYLQQNGQIMQVPVPYVPQTPPVIPQYTKDIAATPGLPTIPTYMPTNNLPPVTQTAPPAVPTASPQEAIPSPHISPITDTIPWNDWVIPNTIEECQNLLNNPEEFKRFFESSATVKQRNGEIRDIKNNILEIGTTIISCEDQYDQKISNIYTLYSSIAELERSVDAYTSQLKNSSTSMTPQQIVNAVQEKLNEYEKEMKEKKEIACSVDDIDFIINYLKEDEQLRYKYENLKNRLMIYKRDKLL